MQDLIVTPFTVAIDNREKRPYDFANVPARRAKEEGRQRVIQQVRKYLPTGDYSLVGYEDRIAIERKSLADLYGTLGRGHDRFKREMERLSEMDVAFVVIEATFAELCQPAKYRRDWRSQVSAKCVYGAYLSWPMRWPTIHWRLVGARRRGEMVTFHLLESFWEAEQRKANQEGKA